MNQYEALFIMKSNLSEEERKNLFSQVADTVTRQKGTVENGSVWAEKRKLYFPIKKQKEGLYYLMAFSLNPRGVRELEHAYRLNENILRVMISRIEKH
ncbi:MAG: 30S ribosomal protein S6 [Candidatus Omnitrophica bacterium]|nr:30S ribosomal protein S6 [Candidatus Omnitrophota bacterium]